MFRLALGRACALERGAFAGVGPDQTKKEMVLCLRLYTEYVAAFVLETGTAPLDISEERKGYVLDIVNEPRLR